MFLPVSRKDLLLDAQDSTDLVRPTCRRRPGRACGDLPCPIVVVPSGLPATRGTPPAASGLRDGEGTPLTYLTSIISVPDTNWELTSGIY